MQRLAPPTLHPILPGGHLPHFTARHQLREADAAEKRLNPATEVNPQVVGQTTLVVLAVAQSAAEELRAAELYEKVSQAFAVFLPVRSVGVMGDARRYDHVIALRAVETVDFMTAH